MINQPEAVATVAALHEEYEAALISNDVEKLVGFFWDSDHALRFGVGESLYGAREIEEFRKNRPPIDLQRQVFNSKIVTFGDDTAISTIEFRRHINGSPRHGRQTQVWRKFEAGWKIVSAHVSIVPVSYMDQASALVGMPIPAANREAVRINLERVAAIVRPLLEFPIRRIDRVRSGIRAMTPTQTSFPDAVSLARAVRAGDISAVEATTAALRKIDRHDGQLNCFTTVLRDSAMIQAADVDRRLAAGQDPGPLCGVPFAVKNLFDIAGVTTKAGSKIHAGHAPAARDAAVVERLKAAGAIALGALNMDEYAYGFTTENSHYGPTRNPHDPERVAGGSSGGSAAAVAAGLLPLTMGSDTNGSIRVPAAFCGIFGLKPTYGRISRAGAFLFCESFDHVGPFARSVRDLALAFDVLHGPDPHDPVCSTRPPEPVLPQLERGIDGLRIAVAGGYFARMGMPEAFAPVSAAARALGVTRTVDVPHADVARASAYVITACEGSRLHFNDLKTRPQDFDPVVVDRFLAGALLPAAWYQQAQRFRTVFRAKMRELFQNVDILLAPATPCPAIRIGQPTITLDGVELPSRPNVGIYTQPLSSVGLPIVVAPVFAPGSLPVGLQIVGAPYNESAVLRVARYLEKMGTASAPVAKGYEDPT